jgi:GNAT superfamily N-acetyltransferase
MKEMLSTLNMKMVRLEENTIIKSFESENVDLNDFLLNDAKSYLKSLLAVTYLLLSRDEIIAYFCLSHDSLTKASEEKSEWNKINRTIPNEKRRRSYPAIKIGRLAVSKNYTGFGLGKFIIGSVIKMYIANLQQAGCRFITVDAYCNALPFYEKNDFKYLTEKDKPDETRVMYLDLKSYIA